MGAGARAPGRGNVPGRCGWPRRRQPGPGGAGRESRRRRRARAGPAAAGRWKPGMKMWPKAARIPSWPIPSRRATASAWSSRRRYFRCQSTRRDNSVLARMVWSRGIWKLSRAPRRADGGQLPRISASTRGRFSAIRATVRSTSPSAAERFGRVGRRPALSGIGPPGCQGPDHQPTAKSDRTDLGDHVIPRHDRVRAERAQVLIFEVTAEGPLQQVAAQHDRGTGAFQRVERERGPRRRAGPTTRPIGRDVARRERRRPVARPGCRGFRVSSPTSARPETGSGRG